jgi:tripartite-type tricarboxylate transporter receptor subunit TctC
MTRQANEPRCADAHRAPVINRRGALGVGAGALAGLLARPAVSAAASLPPGPVTIVIPTAAGGQADIVGRLIGNRVSEIIGRPVIIEAKPGGGGLFAGQAVATAAPNGSTLLFVTGAHSILPGIHRKTIKFDAVRDFSFISTISTVAFAVSVGPDHPARSFAELIDLSRKSPDSQSFASVGVGSTHHLIGELIQRSYGVKWTHVPYRGGSAGPLDVSAGRVSVAIDTMLVTVPLVQGGKLRALAVSQKPRSPQLPDVPAISELPPGVDTGSYLGLAAPAKTPPEIVGLLNQAMVTAVNDPAIQERLRTLGNNPQPSTPEEFSKRVEGDVSRWTRLIADLGIEANP